MLYEELIEKIRNTKDLPTLRAYLNCFKDIQRELSPQNHRMKVKKIKHYCKAISLLLYDLSQVDELYFNDGISLINKLPDWEEEFLPDAITERNIASSK